MQAKTERLIKNAVMARVVKEGLGRDAPAQALILVRAAVKQIVEITLEELEKLDDTEAGTS